MNKTIFVLLDACQYEAGTRNLAFLEHLVDYGKGAKYTRGRAPLELVYQECCGNHSDALKRELEIKAMPRKQKEEMIAAAPISG